MLGYSLEVLAYISFSQIHECCPQNPSNITLIAPNIEFNNCCIIFIVKVLTISYSAKVLTFLVGSSQSSASNIQICIS